MTTIEQDTVFRLLHVVHGGSSCTFESQTDWNKVFAFACQQGVSCLCLDALEMVIKENGRGDMPQDVVLQLYAHTMSVKKNMHAKWQLAQEFASRMKPYKCIVLKGIDYANYWPQPLYREFGDFDCWFGEDYENVNKKAEAIGAKVDCSNFKHSHIYYKGMMIENHQALTAYDGSKIGDKAERLLQSLLSEDDSKVIVGEELWSPKPMFTACFILKHAQRHFITEGIELRHFLDWVYFVDKAGDEIDWERLEGLLQEMKLRNFAEMMTAYCITRLGWSPKLQGSLFNVQHISSKLLNKVDDFVFSEKANVQNKQPIYRAKRLLNRFVRGWHFRKLHYLPYHKAVWSWIAYASTFNRKPVEK